MKYQSNRRQKDRLKKQLDRTTSDMDRTMSDVKPSVQPVQPSVQPKQHCRLPFCVICDPERYQEWFKQTYGYYDDRNKERCPIPG